MALSDYGERSGGSGWLDAVLYDNAPPIEDVLLDGHKHLEIHNPEVKAVRDTSLDRSWIS